MRAAQGAGSLTASPQGPCPGHLVTWFTRTMAPPSRPLHVDLCGCQLFFFGFTRLLNNSRVNSSGLCWELSERGLESQVAVDLQNHPAASCCRGTTLEGLRDPERAARISGGLWEAGWPVCVREVCACLYVYVCTGGVCVSLCTWICVEVYVCVCV